MMKNRNFIAKYMNRFNKPKVIPDKRQKSVEELLKEELESYYLDLVREKQIEESDKRNGECF